MWPGQGGCIKVSDLLGLEDGALVTVPKKQSSNGKSLSLRLGLGLGLGQPRAAFGQPGPGGPVALAPQPTLPPGRV